MSAPPTTLFAADVYAILEPVWADDDQRGYPLLAFIGGISEAFKQGEQVARAQPGRDPYQQLYDVDQCPDFMLPYLGMCVGVTVTPGTSAAAQRIQVLEEAGWARGRPSTLLSAIRATLTGSQRARLTERTSDAWTMLATTDPADTPNPTATNAAAQAAKVAGLILTVIQSSLPLIDEATRTIDAGAATIDTAVIGDVT